jgi:hypothetical protein
VAYHRPIVLPARRAENGTTGTVVAVNLERGTLTVETNEASRRHIEMEASCAPLELAGEQRHRQGDGWLSGRNASRGPPAPGQGRPNPLIAADRVRRARGIRRYRAPSSRTQRAHIDCYVG